MDQLVANFLAATPVWFQVLLVVAVVVTTLGSALLTTLRVCKVLGLNSTRQALSLLVQGVRVALVLCVCSVGVGAVVLAFWARGEAEEDEVSPKEPSRVRAKGTEERVTPAVLVNSLSMKFVLVKPGTYRVGSPATEKRRGLDEHALEVTLTRPFYVAVHETTQGVYRAVMGSNPSHFRPGGAGEALVRHLDADQLPVDCVSWRQARRFGELLSALQAERKAGRSYRLPTEAEWEVAAR